MRLVERLLTTVTALALLALLAGAAAADIAFADKDAPAELGAAPPPDDVVVMPAGAIGGYTFANAAGTYTPLTGDTPFTVNGGGGTLDDGYSADQTIPFPFEFGGTVFTTYRVNTNGWLGFGSPTAPTNYSSLNGTVNNVIAFCSRDMNNAGAVYSSVTEGVAPNRIHKIQAANFYRYNTTTMTGNAQVWLYETTNVVEIHYGTFAATWTSGTTVQVGLRGPSTGVADVTSLTGTGATTWSAPVQGNSSTATMSLALTVYPDAGRTFTFTPGAPAPILATSTKAASKAIARTGETVTYTIVINNSGNATALGATMSDPLPVGEAYVPGSVNTIGVGAAVYNAGTNAIEYGPTDVAQATTVTITYDVTVTLIPPGGPLVNTATFAATNLATPITKAASVALVGGYNDGFYNCTDSLQPGGPAFNWYDATGGTLVHGTVASGGDDDEFTVQMPFVFTFYSLETDSLRLSDNGAIVFGGAPTEITFSNTTLATATLNNLLAPFWDDMDVDTGGLYVQTFGTAPNRVFVIEWFNRPHYSNVGSGTFEVCLFEGTNVIQFQYLDVDFGNASYNQGAGATVGIKGSPIQYSYNQAALVDGLCIQFTPDPSVPVMLSEFRVTAGDAGVLVNWTVGDAPGVQGWNLYRGRTAETIDEPVNAAPIAAAGSQFEVRDAAAGLTGRWFYRLAALLDDGSETTVGVRSVDVAAGPARVSFALAGANPFRGSTAVAYSLPVPMPVRLDVYDLAGRRVKTLVDGDQEAGVHVVSIDLATAGRAGAGVYLLRLKAAGVEKTLRVVSVH